MTLNEYDYPRIRRSIEKLRKAYHENADSHTICVEVNALRDALLSLEQLADELEIRYYSL